MKRQFRALVMKSRHVHSLDRHDAALDLQMCRHRLGFDIGEVAINGEVIVNATEVIRSVKDVTFADRLLNQSFHSLLLGFPPHSFAVVLRSADIPLFEAR